MIGVGRLLLALCLATATVAAVGAAVAAEVLLPNGARNPSGFLVVRAISLSL